MSLKVYVNDSEDDSEEEDDIKRKLVSNPSPILDEEETRQYATMADIEREGDIISEGGGNLALYEVWKYINSFDNTLFVSCKVSSKIYL